MPPKNNEFSVLGSKNWGEMTEQEFENQCRLEKLTRFDIKTLQKPGKKQSPDIMTTLEKWVRENRGCQVRYATDKDGTVACRGGGVLLLMGIKDNKDWPTGKSPEFFYLKNPYRSDIKPWPVQVKDIKHLYYGQFDGITSSNINTAISSLTGRASNKSPARSRQARSRSSTPPQTRRIRG